MPLRFSHRAVTQDHANLFQAGLCGGALYAWSEDIISCRWWAAANGSRTAGRRQQADSAMHPVQAAMQPCNPVFSAGHAGPARARTRRGMATTPIPCSRSPSATQGQALTKALPLWRYVFHCAGRARSCDQDFPSSFDTAYLKEINMQSQTIKPHIC